MAFQGGEPTLEVLLKFYLYSKEGKDGKELIKLDTVNKSNFNPPRINGDGAKITQPVEVENATENDSFVGDETKVTQPAKKESVVGGVTDLSIDIDSVNLSEENCNLKLRFVEKIHDEPINCLLVGFKGCGKSTFANAANKFQYFEECKSEGLEDDDKTIIYSDGVKFNFNAMMDRVKNKNERKIEYNEDMINVYEIYNQKNDKLLFNIIDTPGIEKDKDANVINQSFATLVDRVHHTSNIDCIDLIVFMVDWNHPEEIRLLHSALSSVMNSEEYSRAVENHAFYYIATKTPFNEGSLFFFINLIQTFIS